MFIHSTNKKIIKLENIKKQYIFFKPNGLWYAKNNDWTEWVCLNIKKKYKYKYHYKLLINTTSLDKPDKNKILRIYTMKDLIDFTIKFGEKKVSPVYDHILIDWRKVSKKFGGIEIKKLKYTNIKEIDKYFKSEQSSLIWNNSFDIASGCIWNMKSIKDITLIE
jgi:hypothetical protein